MKQSARRITPGEGERRARRGFSDQDVLAANLIYKNLASGVLRWISLADTCAGGFDDFVLGFDKRIEAYQVRTSSYPKRFNIETLLKGNEALFAKALESQRLLCSRYPDRSVETIFVSDDYPNTNDRIVGHSSSDSSAAFIRFHDTWRKAADVNGLRASRFWPFIQSLQHDLGLDANAFCRALCGLRFVVGPGRRGIVAGTVSDSERFYVRELAQFLNELVSATHSQDRWTASELLSGLGWRDATWQRHTHRFPIDGPYQHNRPTEDALRAILGRVNRGYVSLIGTPGCGKSTLLEASIQPNPRDYVIRYLAFLPNEGHGLGRAEAADFLQDVLSQFSQQGLTDAILPERDLARLRSRFALVMSKAGKRFHEQQKRTIIVVDGLDHIPREESPERSLLKEFPQPQAIPEGVVFVLGTQRLDLPELSKSVRDQAAEPNRAVRVATLSGTSVAEFADSSGVAADVPREEIYVHCGGHPLAMRYVINCLQNAQRAEGRREWLRNGPTWDGDIEGFHNRAWHDVESDRDAQRTLAFLALSEGPIRARSLDDLVGTQAVDAAWNAANHLISRDSRGGWSIFHNSFRLFLLAKTSLRHGREDVNGIRTRYRALARMASNARHEDPQRWMELRYLARAEDQDAVVRLARLERFRSQFKEGRAASEIHDDIRLAFRMIREQPRPGLILELVLAAHEVFKRTTTLVDEVIQAWIAIGDLDSAIGLLRTNDKRFSAEAWYGVVDELLAQERTREARQLFHAREPVDLLFSREGVDTSEQVAAIGEWAKRALAFRDPGEFLQLLERLCQSADLADSTVGTMVDDLSLRCRRIASAGQLWRQPRLSLDQVIADLQLPDEDRSRLLYIAARSADCCEDGEVVLERLEEMVHHDVSAPPRNWINAAWIAISWNRPVLARELLGCIDWAASQDDRWPTDAKVSISWCRKIVEQSAIETVLDTSLAASPKYAEPRIHALDQHLVDIGHLLGCGIAKSEPVLSPLYHYRRTLDLVERSQNNPDDPGNWITVEGMVDETIRAVVESAAALSHQNFLQVTEEIDARLAQNPRRLGLPAVRRAYAESAYRIECDSSKSKIRLTAHSGSVAETPSEQMAEKASTAMALAKCGLRDQARLVLGGIHDSGLGVDLPAKKDPEYRFWGDLFRLSCEDDPDGRPQRLRFFGQLLSGMSETEGRGAARRLAPKFLEQSARAGADWALSAADFVEENCLANWRVLVSSLLVGLVKQQPDLAVVAGIVFDRVVLPWLSPRDDSVIADLITSAADGQVEPVVRHAVRSLETDGRLDVRNRLFREVAEAAENRGIQVDRGTFEVLRTTSPPIEPEDEPDDPFENAETIEDLAGCLEGSSHEARWELANAFGRLIHERRFEAGRKLFEETDELRNSERCIEAMALAALRGGQQPYAVACLNRLEEISDDRSTWGWWFYGDAKLRIHRLRVNLHGTPARADALRVFLDDLANGREELASLLPNLTDTFEVISKEVLWGNLWEHLEGYLREFREFQIGQEFPPTLVEGNTNEKILVDILYRAIDSTAVDLISMSRVASKELAQTAGGSRIVAGLVHRLIKAGRGDALEGARIAWECREIESMRELLSPVLQQMVEMGDYGIRQLAVALSAHWNEPLHVKQKQLPAIYELVLPTGREAEQFHQPIGWSQSSEGLLAEDPLTWTWPLDEALPETSTATGLNLINLRMRAAELMREMGGANVFGPEPFERQQVRLRRLDMRMKYRKLGVNAAFTAMRRVVGEIESAGRFDTEVLPFVSQLAGSYATAAPALTCSARPKGVSRPRFPSRSVREEDTSKRSLEDHLRAPTVEGYIVVASTAVHMRTRLGPGRREFIEQYFGPDIGPSEVDLDSHLLKLPQIFIAEEVVPLYKGTSGAGIAYVRQDIAGAVEPCSLMFCPLVASTLLWHADSRNPFLYRDKQGKCAAKTVYWREGGFPGGIDDKGVHSRGCVVLVLEGHAESIGPLCNWNQVAITWYAEALSNGIRGTSITNRKTYAKDSTN